MYRFCWILFLILATVTPSDAFARDRHSQRRVVVGSRRPAVRVYTRHYSAPRHCSYSRPSYSYHRSYRQPSYRSGYYRSYAPAPRYYCLPRRVVGRSVSVGYNYYRSYVPSYPVVVAAPAVPVVYAASSYAVGDYRVGQYVGGGDYKFRFVGPDGRLCKVKVDDGIIEKIELD